MNLYFKIFATFILPITLGLLFTIFSLNSILENQKAIITQNEKREEILIKNRFQTFVQKIEHDVHLLSKQDNIIEALETNNTHTLTIWTKSFIANQYSAVVFSNANNTIVSQASNSLDFSDKLPSSVLKKITKIPSYKGIINVDNKELLLFSKSIIDHTKRLLGHVILGVIIDEKFLKNLSKESSFSLIYAPIQKNTISSKSLKNTQKQYPFKTNIEEIDQLKRFFIQKQQNSNIQQLENFKINIVTFSILICLIIVLLLYFILSSFLSPYKRIYQLLIEFSQRKADIHHIHNVSQTISKQTTSPEIYNMAKAISKISKKVLKTKEAFKRLSFTDKLTKQHNRRRLEELLIKEANVSSRYKQPLSIILIDIDYFKCVNDRYGYSTGDTILKQFSTFINQNLRESDCFGRWGGEEFLVICPHTNLEGALLLSNRLKKSVKNERYAHNIQLTASFGTAQLHEKETIRNLISRTDEALYKAKNKGKDQIEKAT